MIERYITEESIEFCLVYMTKANLIRVSPRSWLNICSISKCIRGVNVVIESCEEVLKAHFYMLNKTNEVILYLFAHKAIVKDTKLKQ